MGYIEIVNVPKISGICRDPDDDKVLATALFGMIDYLLTRDRDLQTKEISHLLRAAGITIIDIDELVRMLD